MTLVEAGKATLGYFYFESGYEREQNVRDAGRERKQNVRDAVTSLLIQLSAQSKLCCGIIHDRYLKSGNGTRKLSDAGLIDVLQEMITVTAQEQPVFIVMDALDMCPDDGLHSTPREKVLEFIEGLHNLKDPKLHICVTSRLQIDIQTKLEPLAVHAISLHEEVGQKILLSNYISSAVSSDTRLRFRREEDKDLVIKELSARADGM
jgi:hypothetical protein